MATWSFVFLPLLTPLLLGHNANPKSRAMVVDDLFHLKRLSDPQISPDGKNVAYVSTSVDLKANKTNSQILICSIDGRKPWVLVNSGNKDRNPRWSPDGRFILFESNRSGSNQIWLIRLNGGEAKQLTEVSTEASGAIWSPDGKKIAFSSSVYPEFSSLPFLESNLSNRKKKEEDDKNPVKAKVFTKLFFRHWDSFVDAKRHHLFVMPLEEETPGVPVDVTPGDWDAVPTSSTFSSGNDYTFSPDSRNIIFTAPPQTNEAWSTNYDIYRVSVSGGKPNCLTKNNPAADSGPRFSPDGKYLGFRSQKKPGYEADQWKIMVVDVDPSGSFLSNPKTVNDDSHSVDEFVWVRDEKAINQTKWGILFSADHKGSKPIFYKASSGQLMKLQTEGVHGSLTSTKAGTRYAYAKATMNSPPEVYAQEITDFNNVTAPSLSQANTKILGRLNLPRPESVTVEGAGGVPMQMWILKPPFFDPNLKWPVVYLIHGGPQGAWEDGWSYRWCPSLWAAQGYVVALPNPRGSTGFGQSYVDQISGDWGGKCYEDLMRGVDYLEKLPFVDKNRIAAAGASFGGYMVNWFAVNTGRFRCLITHCSVWNFESMY
ncbi:MAG: prolyl oligopeptidase family serine peptidase, partial [Gemmataceae bacterium]